MKKDSRPPVWVGHVVLETDRLADSEQFMRKIGCARLCRGQRLPCWSFAGVRISF